MFCRRSDGKFTGREHTIPESLGNTEIVIPSGIVCDRCNHGTLSDLDQILCGFAPLSIRRMMLGIQTKEGKVPGFRFTEGTVDFLPGVDGADPTLAFKRVGSRPLLKETGRTPDGRVSLEWKGSGGRRMTARYASQLSRALLKPAFECAWLDHPEMMLESRFDHIREAVLGVPRDGMFVIGNKADPHCPNASLTYNLLPHEGDTWRMSVMANFYGVYIGTDSRLPGPVEEPPDGFFSIFTFGATDSRVA